MWQLESASSNFFFSLLYESVALLYPIKFTFGSIQPLISVVKQIIICGIVIHAIFYMYHLLLKCLVLHLPIFNITFALVTLILQ